MARTRGLAAHKHVYTAFTHSIRRRAPKNVSALRIRCLHAYSDQAPGAKPVRNYKVLLNSHGFASVWRELL
jgi:hypothetical protein